MAILLHLQNLSRLAASMDVRHFFVGLDIPEGGVQIVGGEDGDAFINFRSEQDLLRALVFDNQLLIGQRVKLFLAKEIDVQRVVEKRNRELDRAKATFLSASKRTFYAHDIHLDQPSSSHRTYADDEDRPSVSHRTYADDEDRPSVSRRTYADDEDRPSVSHRKTYADDEDRPSVSHRTYADDEDRPSVSHRTYADDRDRPSSSYRTYGVKDDRYNIQDCLSSTHEGYPDKDKSFQKLSSSSYRTYAEQHVRYPRHFSSDDLSPDPTIPFDQAVKKLLEKKSCPTHSSCQTPVQNKSSRVKSYSEKHSEDHSRDRHHSSLSDKKLKQKEEGHEFDMSLPFYALVAQRDLKENEQEHEIKKQTSAPSESADVPPWIKQPRSNGLGKGNNDGHDDRHRDDWRSRDRDDRLGGQLDSRERNSTKGNYNSIESDQKRGRRNNQKKDNVRDKHSSPDVKRSRDQMDKSKDTMKRSVSKGVRTYIKRTACKSREDTPNQKKREKSDQILTRIHRPSKGKESDRTGHEKSVEREGPNIDCIELYNLDVTVTATDIRKFLRSWEIPDGGIILRTDKFDPNAILAYITYYPKKNVEVKRLIGTVLHGRPVEIKSVSLELFDREKVSDQMIEETPPPAPAMGYPNYPPPQPGMYPGPMWMPQMFMPMPGYGPRPGMMAPPPGIPPPGMMPPWGMGPPPRMPPPFPQPPFPNYESVWGPGSLGPHTPPGMMTLYYIRLNPCALPRHCSANEVWSWFEGPHGPTEHAIIVTDSKHVAIVAFVAFLDERQRDEEIVKRAEMKMAARTHSKVHRELFGMGKAMKILQSTESGVDKNITALIHNNQEPHRHRISRQSPLREPEHNAQRERTRSRSRERRRDRSREIRRARSRERRRSISPEILPAYRTPRPQELRKRHENRTKRPGSISSTLSLDSLDEIEMDKKVMDKAEKKNGKNLESKDNKKVENKVGKLVKKKDDKKGIKRLENKGGKKVAKRDNTKVEKKKVQEEEIRDNKKGVKIGGEKVEKKEDKKTEEINSLDVKTEAKDCSGGKTVDDIKSSVNAVPSTNKTESDKVPDTNAVLCADITKSDKVPDVNVVTSADQSESNKGSDVNAVLYADKTETDKVFDVITVLSGDKTESAIGSDVNADPSVDKTQRDEGSGVNDAPSAGKTESDKVFDVDTVPSADKTESDIGSDVNADPSADKTQRDEGSGVNAAPFADKPESNKVFDVNTVPATDKTESDIGSDINADLSADKTECDKVSDVNVVRCAAKTESDKVPDVNVFPSAVKKVLKGDKGSDVEAVPSADRTESANVSELNTMCMNELL